MEVPLIAVVLAIAHLDSCFVARRDYVRILYVPFQHNVVARPMKLYAMTKLLLEHHRNIEPGFNQVASHLTDECRVPHDRVKPVARIQIRIVSGVRKSQLLRADSDGDPFTMLYVVFVKCLDSLITERHGNATCVGTRRRPFQEIRLPNE
jgi:hypothetical protein